ncbi:CTB family bacteriocin [Nostoc sp. 106C]|uniref:CTB family bacteriocin n=1 Tax=Nostoc sp. 106C TaxID=1932667 RepID=UPI000A37057D|nr:CTB family bacteriocin [Nostoc sp. 106C]OUL19024.1 hypothetical protein BV378_33775 [Nostoc sp. RF31YmG]OUL21528.1 hypothetical protein BV375_29295 [Nostoc sp. 106C]
MSNENQAAIELSERELDVVAGGSDSLVVDKLNEHEGYKHFKEIKKSLFQDGSSRWMENERNTKYTLT